MATVSPSTSPDRSMSWRPWQDPALKHKRSSGILTWGLPCSPLFVMTCLPIRGSTIRPSKELHRSLQVRRMCFILCCPLNPKPCRTFCPGAFSSHRHMPKGPPKGPSIQLYSIYPKPCVLHVYIYICIDRVML